MKAVIPYCPRPLQASVHRGRKRFTLLITHRRFGKTVTAVCELLRRALMHGGNVRAWRAGYVAPYLRQAKSIAWDYLKYYAGGVPGTVFNETELRADLPNGARIRLFGADNPDALRGLYFDDLAIDEAADVPRSVWSLVLRPTLADRAGWALFMGTPKGLNNLLADMREAAAKDPEHWAVYHFKASETGYVTAPELARARADMTEDEYAQEFECSFAAAVRGAIYAKELDRAEEEGRIGVIPFEPELPVSTAWDLGIDDAMAIWFFQQEPGGALRILEYFENSGEGLEYYAEYLRGKKWRYHRHIGPHDLMVRELGTGKSRFETARKLGISFTVCRNLPVADGIGAARRLIGNCWFDAAGCSEGIRALRQYQKVWNDKMSLFGKPLHNWASHAADAFRYLAVGVMPERREPRQEKTINRRTSWVEP
ncbi:terminase family protein [Desulfovibrio sp. OttesenSCG-928-I05]|nr:terminase family protein [Desulfovibrio sp. OttesenSCG-928-I05]